jgi:hypothetical protein
VPSAGTLYKLHNQETTVIFSEHLKCLNSFNRYYLFTKQEKLCSLTLQPGTTATTPATGACLLQCVKFFRADTVITMRYVVTGLSCDKGILSQSEFVNQLCLLKEHSSGLYRVKFDSDLAPRGSTAATSNIQ